MKSLLILFLITIVGLNSTRADSVETDVSSKTTTDFYYRGRHPSVLFKCWGKADETSSSSNSTNENSKASVGTINPVLSQDGFQNHTPVTASWASELNEDQVFKVRFSQTVNKEQYNRRETQCNSHDYHSRVTGSNTKLKTAAKLTVPAGVWILRLRANGEAPTQSNEFAIQLRRSKQDERITLTNQPSWQYLFVVPGEEIMLEMIYENSSLNSDKLSAEFEITFIGANRCQQALGSPESIPVDGNALKELLTPKGGEQDVHQFALRAGCIRHPAYLKQIIERSTFKSIYPLSHALTELHTAVKASALPVSESNRKKIEIIYAMTLIDVARSALTDLQAYCQLFKYATLESLKTGSFIKTDGFSFAAMSFSRMLSLIEQIPTAALREYALQLQAAEKNNVTYAQISPVCAESTVPWWSNKQTVCKNEAANLSQALVNTLLGGNYMAFELIATTLDKLPKTQIGSRDREELKTLLREAAVLTLELSSQAKTLGLKLARRRPEVIRVGNLLNLSDTVRRYQDQIRTILKSNAAWFLEPTDGSIPPFMETLSNLDADIMTSISGSFSGDTAAKLAGFLQIAAVQKLHQEVAACLISDVKER